MDSIWPGRNQIRVLHVGVLALQIAHVAVWCVRYRPWCTQECHAAGTDLWSTACAVFRH